ncbi:MAG: hypothetical protein EB014_05045, partial [Actinobacteria bacterium]|nr:hypothetical protein [Actinomycetota bacterium]
VILHLRSLALIYSDGVGYRLPRAVRDLLGNEPAGLGPESATKIDLKLIDKAPAGAKAILEKLTWGPPRGQVGDIRKKGTPISWLLDNNLLIPIDTSTVALAREVGIYLRGNKVHKESKSSSLRSLSSAAKVGLKPEELFTTPVSDITG